MKNLNNTLRLAILSLSYTALLSCSSSPIMDKWDKSSQDPAIDAAKSTVFKQGITVSDTAQRALPIRIPKTAPWLLDSVNATYQGGLDAKTTILALLHNQPVRFELSGNGPKVTANPSATTFQEHLDSIAAQANWAYTITKGVVIFSDWQVVNYPLDFILGDKKVQMNNDTGGNTLKGSWSNKLLVNNNNHKELDRVIQKILANSNDSPNHSAKKPSYSVVKASNSIMVSAPPNIQKQVRNALNSINDIAGRSIYLDFDIYSVDLHKEYQQAVDIRVLKQNGVNLTSSITSAPNIFDSISSIPQIFSLNFNGNGYNSAVLLKALAEHGEASLVNQGTLLLKNNEVGNVRTSSLNRWIELVNVPDFRSSAPSFKDSIIQVLPSIKGEQINLHMLISDTDSIPYLKSLKRETETKDDKETDKISAESEMIKLGDQFVIPTEVENGETLLIAGITSKVYNDSSGHNQILPIIGDSRDRQQRRRETIIVMTAYLLD